MRKWYSRKNAVYVHYENLITNTSSELQRIVFELSGKRISYDMALEISLKYLGARKAEENKHSFMRKGVVGDWKNHFSSESSRFFDHYAGDELITLGYKKNQYWVNSN